MIYPALSGLIGEIYEAASGEAPFSPLAPKIASAFGSGICLLQIRNGFAGPIENLSVTPEHNTELIASYDSFYQQQTRVAGEKFYSANSGFLSQNYIVNGEIEDTTIYRRHAGPTQKFHVFDAIIPIGGPDNATGILGIHRHENELLFSSEEKRQGTLFLPHLKRALQLRERLARSDLRQQAMLQTMEKLTLGVMLVTCRGRVQFANQAAEELLRRGSGLVVQNSRLHATSPVVDYEFQRLLRSATQAVSGPTTQAGGLIRLPRQDAKSIILSIYPFLAPDSSNGHRVASALIFISDPGLHRPPRGDVLAQMYGLTGAEAKLFEALLTGERLQHYADRCSIGMQTVKTQLSRLFNKTGSARQTDLVRDGLSNPLLSLTKR